jgi:DnaD/phage-associated family protein
VDYKSGKKAFDLSAVKMGLDIQMLLYLFTLQKEGKAYFGKEIEPAGVLYLPARDEILTAERNIPPEKLEKEREKNLRRSGLLLAEPDVLQAMDQEASFRLLRGEVQRLLGRNLNTEDLKILLGFVHYLGLPAEVVSVLVSFCKDRSRNRGNLRAPSLRTIEKEAYHWAEQGIDTLEAAAAYIQTQNNRNSKIYQLMDILQIRGRGLTSAEERFANAWLEMDFPKEVITMAYERTCLNTGGLSWAYMNKILMRWHQAGFHTAEDVRSGDRKPVTTERKLDADERAAIQRMMQEG